MGRDEDKKADKGVLEIFSTMRLKQNHSFSVDQHFPI